jgi:DinB superfamily
LGTRLTGKGLPANWSSLRTSHSDALAQYLATAARMLPAQWGRPLSHGKWSPAQITSHLSESYQVLHSELRGGSGMRLLGSPLRRWILHVTIMPRLLSGSPFPPGVRAPKETRPLVVEPNPEKALEVLSARAEIFVQELTDQLAHRRVRLSHAYFGLLSAEEGIRLVTVHTLHHARQLDAAPM